VVGPDVKEAFFRGRHDQFFGLGRQRAVAVGTSKGCEAMTRRWSLPSGCVGGWRRGCAQCRRVVVKKVLLEAPQCGGALALRVEPSRTSPFSGHISAARTLRLTVTC